MRVEEAKILVVDDEAALATIFAKWLRSAGCMDVRIASNGKEAMAAVEQDRVDVLITDVCMPVMDGVTLVRQLAQRGEHIHTIIFVSGFGDVDRREMYDLGVESFLSKPFGLEDLSAALHRAMAEPGTLWTTPMEISPRQKIHMRVGEAPAEGAEQPEEAGMFTAAHNFCLGRGGFSVQVQEPLGLGKVEFVCVFDRPSREADGVEELAGQGYVRWRSRADFWVGIEFSYLDLPGREWVVKQLAENNPRPFIPAPNACKDSS